MEQGIAAETPLPERNKPAYLETLDRVRYYTHQTQNIMHSAQVGIQIPVEDKNLVLVKHYRVYFLHGKAIGESHSVNGLIMVVYATEVILKNVS